MTSNLKMGIAELSVIYRRILCLPSVLLLLIPGDYNFRIMLPPLSKSLLQRKRWDAEKILMRFGKSAGASGKKQLGKGTTSPSAVFSSNTAPFRTPAFPLG